MFMKFVILAAASPRVPTSIVYAFNFSSKYSKFVSAETFFSNLESIYLSCFLLIQLLFFLSLIVILSVGSFNLKMRLPTIVFALIKHPSIFTKLATKPSIRNIPVMVPPNSLSSYE